MEHQKLMKTIIITSIYYPTEAVISFSEMTDYRLIVVGDKKTPDNWHYKNIDYISVVQQEELGYKLAKVIPYNHYCRKMLGYLKAIQNGSEFIVDADDDNIPKNDWQFQSLNKDMQGSRVSRDLLTSTSFLPTRIFGHVVYL
jgi:hypothetical protein